MVLILRPDRKPIACVARRAGAWLGYIVIGRMDGIASERLKGWRVWPIGGPRVKGNERFRDG